MKLFTISSGKVTEGALVFLLELKAAGATIPAIIVGEEGRGRSRGVLPVQLFPEQEAEWKEKGETIVSFGSLTTTRSGKPKLIALKTDSDSEHALCVFRTKIGFRGSNYHTGERKAEGEGFEDFPGETIVSGVIAEGDAGRMGAGQQLIAVMPKNVVFRTAYTGRLYGNPFEHYYMFDGEKIIGGLTAEERDLSEIF